MKQNSYKIISTILQELNLVKTVKQTGLGIGRNIKKDKVSAAMIAAGLPFPGGTVPGITHHITKSKPSQKRLMVLGRKLTRPSQWTKASMK